MKKKLTIDIEMAVEERVKELVDDIIAKHWHAADAELSERMQELSDKLKKEVAQATKEMLQETITVKQVLHRDEKGRFMSVK